MTSIRHEHLRNPTTTIPLPNPNTSPPRPNSSCNREIRPIRPTPLTPSCHRRTYPRIRPTPLQHNSSSRDLPINPNSPPIQQQSDRPNPLPLPRSPIHSICSYMRSHPKRYQKNYCLLHLKSTRPNNSYNRTKPPRTCLPSYLNPRILQSHTLPMLRIHYPQPKRRTRHSKNRRTPKNNTHYHLMPNHRKPSPNRNTFPSRILLKRSNHRKPKHLLPKHLSLTTDPTSHILYRSLHNSHDHTRTNRLHPNFPPNSNK